MANPVKDPLTGAETTGHVWDDTLQEFNNPLPRWWLWAFYGTFIFAISYWVIYPSWPIGNTFTKGIGDITYTKPDGKVVSNHWNMRSLLAEEQLTSDEAIKRREYLAKIAAAPYEQIAQDQDMSAFVRSYGNSIFGDKCAACHQVGGQGVIGMYPNLVDDDWLWGNKPETIEATIRGGRLGYMPAFKNTFNKEQITEVANYVLSLSGLEHNAESAAIGSKIFNGQEGGCYYCHTHEGTGMNSQGSANLTDKVWTIADVPDAASTEAKLAAVEAVISNGVNRQMPAFTGRLSDAEIKVLVAYLQQMSSSQ